ncbi:MAG: M15 family metallopeptidase [bacterium]
MDPNRQFQQGVTQNTQYQGNFSGNQGSNIGPQIPIQRVNEQLFQNNNNPSYNPSLSQNQQNYYAAQNQNNLVPAGFTPTSAVNHTEVSVHPKKPIPLNLILNSVLVGSVIFVLIGITVFLDANRGGFVPKLKSPIFIEDTVNLDFPKYDDGFSAGTTNFKQLTSWSLTQDGKFKAGDPSKPAVDPALYKNFTGPQFKDFYNSFQYTKVTPPSSTPSITGNPQADARVAQLAQTRGYLRRNEAIQSGLIFVDGQKLQPEARQSWLSMKSAAANDGIKLVLVSGFRSVDDQRSLFLEDFGSKFNSDQVVAGQADSFVNSILVTRSIPGFSRHHTGYTLDVGCNSTDLLPFGATACFTWMSQYNYLNSKRFGFIPSYPPGAGLQGPDPEPWEFVWVGEFNLRS